nr:hypothetical protein [uncultured Desulfobulbus sp.]
MRKFVVIRDLLIFFLGVWFFEFYLNYRLPDENNLLLFFVAIPVVWTCICQFWTSYSYSELDDKLLIIASHILSMVMLLGTVFMVSAVINTIADVLEPVGNIMFHTVGWTVIAAMIMYDVVDSGRKKDKRHLE